MTWSYSGNPSDSTVDALRFLTGDTDTNEQLLSNEEITYISTAFVDVNLAGAELCEAIAAKFARKVNTTNGDLRIDAQKRYEQYIDLAKKLRTKGNRLAIPWAGGRLLSEKEIAQENTAITQPAFKRGMDDFPENNESLDNNDYDNNWR
ncbi:MAG: hypothetical protein PHC43_01125 [Candidatus Marinimicrobia bacterium]|nr:hypothetical protein [Candidatus Neomarinimicrobiota bacterium]